MSAAKLISLLGTTSVFFRIHSLRVSSSAISPARSSGFLPSQFLPSHRYAYCSAAAVSSDTVVDALTSGDAALGIGSRHPWPEWVAFVDRLKAKGYLSEAKSSPRPAPPGDATDDGVGGEVGDAAGSDMVIYKDIKSLKDACLSFGRDRFDIFKSLSRDDIEAVVGKGCPTLLRKAVNSAKRLRAHVHLDEGSVCGECSLRGSCDRAYVILQEPDASARTVDVLRILLFCALDPLVLSGGEKPPGRELVEVSARNLLSQLTLLGDSSPDQFPPKDAVKATKQKAPSLGLKSGKLSSDVEMKRGDWMCPKCNFLNFARNLRCPECGENGPKQISSGDIQMKKGDWICSECNFMNFAKNIRCLKCKAEGPKRINLDDVEMKKGDWNCPQCGFMNFASKLRCMRCREPRPQRELNPGEWECSSCGFLNFRGNLVCKKCQHDRPDEVDR